MSDAETLDLIKKWQGGGPTRSFTIAYCGTVPDRVWFVRLSTLRAIDFVSDALGYGPTLYDAYQRAILGD